MLRHTISFLIFFALLSLSCGAPTYSSESKDEGSGEGGGAIIGEGSGEGSGQIIGEGSGDADGGGSGEGSGEYLLNLIEPNKAEESNSTEGSNSTETDSLTLANQRQDKNGQQDNTVEKGNVTTFENTNHTVAVVEPAVLPGQPSDETRENEDKATKKSLINDAIEFQPKVETTAKTPEQKSSEEKQNTQKPVDKDEVDLIVFDSEGVTDDAQETTVTSEPESRGVVDTIKNVGVAIGRSVKRVAKSVKCFFFWWAASSC